MNKPGNLSATCYIQTTLLIFFVDDGEPFLAIFSVIGEDLYNTVVSVDL